MPRIIQDRSFQRWEAFATTGRYGLPHPGRIVFRCCSDRSQPSRVVEVAGDKSDAEALVAGGEHDELLDLLEGAVALD